MIFFSRRGDYNPWVHWVMPLLGAAVFIPPIYYQYFPLPAYPVRIADWVALGWLAGGALAVAFAPRRILDNVANLFVGETPVGIAGPDVLPQMPSGAAEEPA